MSNKPGVVSLGVLLLKKRQPPFWRSLKAYYNISISRGAFFPQSPVYNSEGKKD